MLSKERRSALNWYHEQEICADVIDTKDICTDGIVRKEICAVGIIEKEICTDAIERSSALDIEKRSALM